MVNIKRRKKELAEKIASKKGHKKGSQIWKDTVKSLSRLSLDVLNNLK